MTSAMASAALTHVEAIGFAALTAFVFAFFLTPFVRSIAVRSGWIARPVEDRWGRRIVARSGGVALFVSILAASVLWVPFERTVIGLLIGMRISLIQWGWMGIPCSVLWCILVMDAFNLLDNMDGLAAGIGAIAAGFCAVHGLRARV